MNTDATRRILILTSLFGCLWVFLSVINFATLVLRFIAVGQVPGTDVYLSSNDMYGVLLVLLLVNLAWIAPELYTSLFSSLKSLRKPAKKPALAQKKA